MSDQVWNDNFIQFTRLLAEIHMVAELTPDQLQALCRSMDLPREHLDDLFERALQQFEQIKQGHEPARSDSDAARELRQHGDLLTRPSGDLEQIEIKSLAGLSTRARHCLRRAGIRTVGQLLQLGRDRMLALPGFGKTCYRNVKWQLANLNIMPPADLWPLGDLDAVLRRKADKGRRNQPRPVSEETPNG